MKDNDSLAHTKWKCKYHVVFAPKYRRQVIYGELRAEIGQILRKLCEQKGIEIIEANACPSSLLLILLFSPSYVSLLSFSLVDCSNLWTILNALRVGCRNRAESLL